MEITNPQRATILKLYSFEGGVEDFFFSLSVLAGEEAGLNFFELLFLLIAIYLFFAIRYQNHPDNNNNKP